MQYSYFSTNHETSKNTVNSKWRKCHCALKSSFNLCLSLLSLYIKTPNRLFSLRNPVAVAWSHNKRSQGQRTNDKNPAPAKATSDNESGQVDSTLRGQCVLSKQTYNLWCKASRISLISQCWQDVSWHISVRDQSSAVPPLVLGVHFLFFGMVWVIQEMITDYAPDSPYTFLEKPPPHTQRCQECPCACAKCYWDLLKGKEKKKYFHLWIVPSPGRESRSSF